MVVYKRDVFAFDLICMTISDELTAVEINEQDAGWEEFIRAVETKLPGSMPIDAWLPVVSQPPFAISQTTVYFKRQTG